MEVTDAVLKNYLTQVTDDDITGDPGIRALRSELADLVRQHAAAIAKGSSTREAATALPGQIIDAEKQLGELASKTGEIGADIVCGIVPERIGRDHDRQLEEAAGRLSRLKLAWPVLTKRGIDVQRPVGHLADRMHGVRQQIEAAVDEAKLRVARSRL